MCGVKILAAAIPILLVIICREKLKELQVQHLIVFLAFVKRKKSFFNQNIVRKNGTGVLISWKALSHSRGFDCTDVIPPQFSWLCCRPGICIFVGLFLSLHLHLNSFICQVTASYKGTPLHRVTADAKSPEYKSVQVPSGAKGFSSVSVPLQHLCTGANWLSCLPHKIRQA